MNHVCTNKNGDTWLLLHAFQRYNVNSMGVLFSWPLAAWSKFRQPNLKTVNRRYNDPMTVTKTTGLS